VAAQVLLAGEEDHLAGLQAGVLVEECDQCQARPGRVEPCRLCS